MKLFDYLWILPFGSFLIGYLFFYFLFHVPNIEAPLLIGKNLAYASRVLSGQNLNLRIITQKEDNDLPDGTIISQTPNPGQKIKANQALFCVVSQKAQTGITPQCINLSCQQIQEIFKKENLRVKKQFIESKYPAGLCVGQIPAPGTPLEQKIIQTYISSGSSKLVLFPQLKGMLAREVIEFLKPYNLHPTVHHRTAIELQHQCTLCKIIDQRPLAGSLVDLSKLLQVQLQIR